MSGDRIEGGFSGLTSNPNDLALSLDLIIPFVWFLFLSSKSGIQKSFTGATVVISLACIVLTSSRGGAITFLVMFIWYCWNKTTGNRLGALLVMGTYFDWNRLDRRTGWVLQIGCFRAWTSPRTRPGSASARWETLRRVSPKPLLTLLESVWG